MTRAKQHAGTPAQSHASPPGQLQAGHDGHCFIVMPSGRDAVEHKWFKGWYEVVVRPAVIEAGYAPILAATEEQPGAINDEIRTHLAVDPMVVVDLGGAEPEDDPNPNVMYELGIRHALDLPLVMMAWKGQRLPFDVSNQRVIMEDRDLIDLEGNRRKLHAFIRAAAEGRYYRPMEAVSRLATIQVASEALGEDSLLRALAREVRDLRDNISTLSRPFRNIPYRAVKSTIKHVLRVKRFQKDLYPHYEAAGGDAATWGRLLRTPLDATEAEHLHKWTLDEWRSFVIARGAEAAGVSAPLRLIEAGPRVVQVPPPSPQPPIDLELLDRVRGILPAQPWPTGIHKQIAEQLGLPLATIRKCITELIRRGDFADQVGGQIIPPAPPEALP